MLDGWKAMLLADVGSLGPSIGPFATLIIGCTVSRVGVLWEFGTDSGHEGWEPSWYARGLDVRHWEDWRSRVLAQYTRLLIDAGTCKPSNSWVLSSTQASIPGCMTAVSTSPTQHVGSALGWAAVERNHGRSFTKLAGLTWERTSSNVVSKCSHNLACWSFYTSASFSCSWSSFCSSWAIAWVTACNCLRAMPMLSVMAVCVLSSLLVQGEVEETESSTREDKWWSWIELSCSASLVNRMTVRLSPSLCLGKTTWVGEYRSSQHRHSWERWNW